ncbi:hypothetical protein [Halalkalibacillus halophilus]|uniref:hypothetical protein n=1 Tax=Halalkalibacillus halophilus TaxID=392827 RepID=UPI0004015953|nr:hypothetical protein [Halalkalibacillus halophilus]
MNHYETIEKDRLSKKNRLMFWFLVAMTLISTAANYIQGLDTSVLATVFFGGLFFVSIIGLLLFLNKGDRVIPYIAILGLASVLALVVLEVSVSTHNFGLLLFLIVAAGLYMSIPLLLTGLITSLVIFHAFIYLHGDVLDLNYTTALANILFVAILLYGLQLITKDSDQKTFRITNVKRRELRKRGHPEKTYRKTSTYYKRQYDGY